MLAGTEQFGSLHPIPGSNRISKIEPVTCKILAFLPKNTGIKLKTMHARGIHEKVGQVTLKYNLRYDTQGLAY